MAGTQRLDSATVRTCSCWALGWVQAGLVSQGHGAHFPGVEGQQVSRGRPGRAPAAKNVTLGPRCPWSGLRALPRLPRVHAHGCPSHSGSAAGHALRARSREGTGPRASGFTRLPCPGPLCAEASVSHGGAPASGTRLPLRGRPLLQVLLWVVLWWVRPGGPALLEPLWGQDAVCSVLSTSQLESWIGLLRFFYQKLLALCENKVSHIVLSLICLVLHVSLNSQSSWSPEWGGGCLEGAGAQAPAAIPGLTRLCVCFQFTHTNSPDNYTVSSIGQTLHFELDAIFTLLILVTWTRRFLVFN